MNITELEGRLKMIEAAMQHAIANWNTLEGGKQECLYWLERLKTAESTGTQEAAVQPEPAAQQDMGNTAVADICPQQESNL